MGVVKKFQNPSGGLDAAGRAHYKRTTGAILQLMILIVGLINL